MITAHKNTRILISLLKQYGIKYFVLSPGSRNISIVKSVEDDPYFTCYSVVDERSAAYFAIGLSLELRSPVAITCTSAQATRNYIPGMTEAFYRKAPILAITTDYDENFIDQLNMQAIQQMSIPRDSAKISVDIPIVKDKNDEHLVTRRINEAIDYLKKNGGGPAHINIRISKHWTKGDDKLEKARKISRYLPLDKEWPLIKDKKVLLIIGQHHPFSKLEFEAIEAFADKYDVAIYVNHISNYNGNKSVHGNICLIANNKEIQEPDLVITIGGHLGDYLIDGYLKQKNIEHWRVSEDGKYGDTYNTLTKVFECTDQYFFERMDKQSSKNYINTYYEHWVSVYNRRVLPQDFTLSHAYVAMKLAPKLPEGSNLHFSILNSLRFWEFFSISDSIKCYSNVAGFGIDGCLSTFLGQSVASEDKLNILIIGDLSFFYDMNSIGIRHLKNNVRIIMINNRGGAEFRLHTNAADQFGDSSNRHIAASGHFGESTEGWVVNNGFEYICVREKEEFDNALKKIVTYNAKPIFLEVFTKMKDEADELEKIKKINMKEESFFDSVKKNIPVSIKKNIKNIISNK